MKGIRNSERLETIRRLAKQGLTKAAIARQLDISIPTVLHYERTYGLVIKKDPRAVAVKTVKNVPWTEDEETYLIYALEDCTINLTEIGQELGRTSRSVSNKIHDLKSRGLVDDKAGRQFSDKELAYIIKHYRVTPTKVIAEKLGRSVKSIQQKADRLGLAKPMKRDMVEQIETLISEGYWLNQIARKLQVSHSLLLHYERTRGLTIPRESPEERAERVRKNVDRFWKRQDCHYIGKY